MMCPICVEQNEKTRDTIDAQDMVGHFLRLHTKPELAYAFAKFLWQEGSSAS